MIRYRHRPYKTLTRRPRFHYAGYTPYRRNSIDPTLLISLRRNLDDIDKALDPTRLTLLRKSRRRRNLDPVRLTSLRRRNHWRRRNLDPVRLTSLRRRNSIRRNPFNRWVPRQRFSRFRRNPDPHGNPWGPQLYNPLKDDRHKFKNESHYNKMIARLRRNPW